MKFCYYYSPSKDCFYPADWLKDYPTPPSDLMGVSDEVFTEFSINKSGRTRLFIDGEFEWSSDVKETTPSEARAWRDSELRRADIEINKIQDSSSTKGSKKLCDWRKYRCNLRDWPASAGFPLDTSRPNPPDYEE